MLLLIRRRRRRRSDLIFEQNLEGKQPAYLIQISLEERMWEFYLNRSDEFRSLT